MEQDIMSSHSDSSLPLDGDGDCDGGAGSEDDEFGDFSLPMVCSPSGLADAAAPPLFHRQTSPTLKPATHQLNSSFNHLVEQNQHTSAVKLGSDRRHVDEDGPTCNPESSLHYSNEHADGDLGSETFSASSVNSPAEETGFADFTLFTEQAGHPWCCGFTEQWDRRVEEANVSSGEQACNLRQDAVTASESKTQHACKKDVCTDVKHCEKRNAVLVQPPQGHNQPREPAALSLASVEEQHIPGNTQEVQTLKARVPQMVIENEPASADQTFYCDGFLFERASEEMEPQFPPSLVSQGNQSIKATDEVEKPENCRHSVSLVRSKMANRSLSELHLCHCNHYTTQETSATSSQSHLTNTQDKFAHVADGHLEHHRDQEPVQTADTRIESLGNLPSSDSFADFCSAPTQEDKEGHWADFKHQNVPMEGKTWTWFREPVSSFYGGKENKEEQDGATGRNSCQASLSCRVQLLLRSSFPEIPVPIVEDEEELLSLDALLQIQDLPESEAVIPELSHALRIQQLMLGPHQDVYHSLGLQFKWGGSHAYTSLLSCLGVDARNIVCMGTKTQPVTVSTYVSGLGMLEPTKDPLSVVYSPQPKGSQCTPVPSAHSAQGLPSRPLNWSARSLSSSQEGMSPCRAPHM